MESLGACKRGKELEVVPYHESWKQVERANSKLNKWISEWDWILDSIRCLVCQ